MERNVLEEKVRSCLQQLYDQDIHILVQDCAERTICGKLANILASEFPHHHVDIEYNRKGFGLEPKDIELPNENGDLTNNRVFPDIIVHKRGDNIRNLLAIEVKKSTNAIADEHDHAKLLALCWQFRYRNGLFLRLSTGPGAAFRLVHYDWFEGPLIEDV